jgi:hypothetical protein
VKTQTRSATALLVLSAVVGACGGASATASPVSPGQASAPAQASLPGQASAPTGSTVAINACALLTEQEATTFLGSDPGPGQDVGDATLPACAYDASLSFSVDPTAGKAKFDSDTAGLQGSSNYILSGVGDGAAATIVGGMVARMEILKGSAILTVNVQSGRIFTVAELTTLAATMVGRL